MSKEKRELEQQPNQSSGAGFNIINESKEVVAMFEMKSEGEAVLRAVNDGRRLSFEWYAIPPYMNGDWEIHNEDGGMVAVVPRKEDCLKIVALTKK